MEPTGTYSRIIKKLSLKMIGLFAYVKDCLLKFQSFINISHSRSSRAGYLSMAPLKRRA